MLLRNTVIIILKHRTKTKIPNIRQAANENQLTKKHRQSTCTNESVFNVFRLLRVVTIENAKFCRFGTENIPEMP